MLIPLFSDFSQFFATGLFIGSMIDSLKIFCELLLVLFSGILERIAYLMNDTP